MDDAFEYVEKTSLETESDYPYTGVNGKCHNDKSKGVTEVKGFTDVTPLDPTALESAVV